jgi:hypothetical protein
LAKLIEDALAELTGEKFATLSQGMGDLDSADGTAFLTDYRASDKSRRAFLRMDAIFHALNEEATAAHYLSAKLYGARFNSHGQSDCRKSQIRRDRGDRPRSAHLATTWAGFRARQAKASSHASRQDRRAIKAKRQKPKIDALHAKIQKRAKAMKGGYSKTEALDVLEREFPGYSRRQLSNIVSSVFPPRPRRASSSE